MTQRDHVGYPYVPVAKRTSAARTTEDYKQQPTVVTRPQRNQRGRIDAENDESQIEEPPQKPPTSAIRLNRPPHRTTTLIPPVMKTRRLRRVRFHWFVFVGLAMFIMILGWLTFSALSSWWTVQQDDWHYGRPRTFQTDAVVGHNDSRQNPSHFLAMNLHGKVMVIEFPGGDASKAKVYLGPQLFGNGQDLAAVTLTFEDRNGDGKPDLNIHIEGSDQVIVFLNDGKEFVSSQQH